MEYTVDYFIEKFEKIPEDKWCTGLYSINNKHCALGHCGETKRGSTHESAAFTMLFSAEGFIPIRVNDGNQILFPQPTPKQRILAALNYIKSKK